MNRLSLGCDALLIDQINSHTSPNKRASTSSMPLGFYCHKFLPENVHAMSVAEMTGTMLKEIRVGVGESGVQCGIIYLGCSWPLHSTEERALRAAAAVQQAEGIITSHF